MKITFYTIVVLALSAYCFGTSPLAHHPNRPPVGIADAILSAVDHIRNENDGAELYISKIELIEGSVIPAPRGSERHWKITAQRAGEERKKVAVYYIDMTGAVSTVPPPRASPPNKAR